MIDDAEKSQPLKTLSIGDRQIGFKKPTYVIAEVGSNHNGSLGTARKFVQLSAQAGADAIKFQAYSRETLFSPCLPEDGNKETQGRNDLLRRRWDTLPHYSASDAWWSELKSLCDEIGIDFLVTSFDLDRLKLLNQMDVKAHKIASGDITWMEFLKAAGATGKPVILSTGASALNEVKRALEALAEGGCEQIALLHCISNYPPKWEDINLRAIGTLQTAFQVPIGFSDHSPGATLPVAAVVLGACIIEKHVTLDRDQNGLDHAFAMELDEFASMVEEIRHVEAAIGNGTKTWVETEEIERYWVRRGLWAKCQIDKGEVITREKLDILRPCHGLPAELLSDVLGRKAAKNIPAGQPLEGDSTI